MLCHCNLQGDKRDNWENDDCEPNAPTDSTRPVGLIGVPRCDETNIGREAQSANDAAIATAGASTTTRQQGSPQRDTTETKGLCADYSDDNQSAIEIPFRVSLVA